MKQRDYSNRKYPPIKCGICGKMATCNSAPQKYCEVCSKKHRREYMKEYRKLPMAKERRYERDSHPEARARIREREHTYYLNNPERKVQRGINNRAWEIEKILEYRRIVAKHYNYCIYCKQFNLPIPPLEIIEIHHKNGNGKEDRGRGKGRAQHKKIIDAGFPDDLLAICPNHHTMIHKGLIIP